MGLHISGSGMTIMVRLVLVTAALVGIATAGHSQDLSIDGLLKGPDGSVAAALALAPGDRAVAAYVVRGTSEDAKSGKKLHWSEVRLLDLATGRHRVLDRAATPEWIPGISANHTLRGFKADGKKVAATTTDPGGTTRELLLEVVDSNGKE
jgi:hypothetical protein